MIGRWKFNLINDKCLGPSLKWFAHSSGVRGVPRRSSSRHRLITTSTWGQCEKSVHTADLSEARIWWRWSFQKSAMSLNHNNQTAISAQGLGSWGKTAASTLVATRFDRLKYSL